MRMEGKIGGEERIFTVGIGPAAQAKHSFQVGDMVQGECLPADETRSEPAEFYKVSKLKLVESLQAEPTTPPPWTDVPSALEVYQERGFRRRGRIDGRDGKAGGIFGVASTPVVHACATRSTVRKRSRRATVYPRRRGDRRVVTLWADRLL